MAKHAPIGMTLVERFVTRNGRVYNKHRYRCDYCQKEKVIVAYMMATPQTFLVCTGTSQTRKNAIF